MAYVAQQQLDRYSEAVHVMIFTLHLADEWPDGLVLFSSLLFFYLCKQMDL
jgi:hypothetical protein